MCEGCGEMRWRWKKDLEVTKANRVTLDNVELIFDQDRGAAAAAAVVATTTTAVVAGATTDLPREQQHISLISY